MRKQIAPVYLSVLSAAILMTSDIAIADHGTNFHCSGNPFSSELAASAIDNLGHNKTMKVIVREYTLKWENQQIRETCDAAVAGSNVDLSCFDDRRDWDAIASSIPDNLRNLDRTELKPFQLELQKQKHGGSQRIEALKYCEDLGVIDLKVKG